MRVIWLITRVMWMQRRRAVLDYVIDESCHTYESVDYVRYLHVCDMPREGTCMYVTCRVKVPYIVEHSAPNLRHICICDMPRVWYDLCHICIRHICIYDMPRVWYDWLCVWYDSSCACYDWLCVWYDWICAWYDWLWVWYDSLCVWYDSVCVWYDWLCSVCALCSTM